MAKSLFLFIISGLIGVIMHPGILAASDTVTLSGLNPNKIVETIPLPEPEPEIVHNNTAILAPTAGVHYDEPVYEPQMTNYNVTIHSGEIVATGLSYYDIYKTNKLVYGHNSWNLLGNLPTLGWGETFTVTEGGSVQTYQVANIIVYEKNVDRGTLQRDGQGSYMRAVLNAIDKDSGVHYDLALMTCYGTAYGNGDASHRYVVFANAV